MKILYFHQYFKIPEEGGGLRSYYLAKGLVGKGHTVEMITAHDQEEYQVKEVEGIKVHYLPIPYSNHLSFFQRIIAFLRFINQSIQLASRIKDVDLNYVMTTPLSTGVVALYLKWIKRTPYFFEVGDLWPAVPIQMGIIKNPLLKWLLHSFEKLVYRKSDRLVALSPDIQKYIKQKAPKIQSVCIPNIADTITYLPSKETQQPFTIGYFGTIGKANHIEFLLAAANHAKQEKLALEFIVAGEGSELERIKKKSEQQKLTNITFYPFGNREQIVQLMKKCEAVYVSFWDKPLLATGSPNKFFDGLAAGKFVIINFQGWIKALIEKEGCGFSYNPNQPEEFVQQLKPFLSDKVKLKQVQDQSRKLAERQFSKEKAVEDLDDFVVNVLRH
ncbi:MAG: glycosyltransferase family 4 protein [Cyclobacteriaceae bacterium]